MFPGQLTIEEVKKLLTEAKVTGLRVRYGSGITYEVEVHPDLWQDIETMKIQVFLNFFHFHAATLKHKTGDPALILLKVTR